MIPAPRSRPAGSDRRQPPAPGLPANRVSQIINGRRSITGDTALRFGHWFSVEPEFWLNLQAHYDLVHAENLRGDTIRHLPTRADLEPRDELPDAV